MKKILILIVSILSITLANATIVLKMGKGIDQGSYNRKVTVGECTPISEEESTISLSCYAGGSTICPTNETLRKNCPNAIIVPWISNQSLDLGVGTVLSLWNQGNGQQSGTHQTTLYNTGNGETAQLSFVWITLATGEIQITIDAVLI